MFSNLNDKTSLLGEYEEEIFENFLNEHKIPYFILQKK